MQVPCKCFHTQASQPNSAVCFLTKKNRKPNQSLIQPKDVMFVKLWFPVESWLDKMEKDFFFILFVEEQAQNLFSEKKMRYVYRSNTA